jgi:cell fate (sporulation/competence/biofilm development) regulator YlbF (YheA/YmcA/DUF963 family)
MSMMAEDSSVMEKTRALCATILEHPDFGLLQEKVEEFLADDAARLQFQSVQERGEELHHRQHAGVELSQGEVNDWEEARAGLLENDLVRSFLEARNQLETLQMTIGRYVGMTLELGRVPSPDDFAARQEGCCGGGGHGGCGCEH